MPASAQKRREFGALGLAELDPITYIHPYLLLVRGTDKQLNRMAGVSRSAKPSRLSRANIWRLFTSTRGCTAGLQPKPTCNNILASARLRYQMVLTLERAGFIRRQPRTARSIELLVEPQHLPELL